MGRDNAVGCSREPITHRGGTDLYSNGRYEYLFVGHVHVHSWPMPYVSCCRDDPEFGRDGGVSRRADDRFDGPGNVGK